MGEYNRYKIRVEIKQVKRSQLMREKNDTNRISKTASYSISWQTTSPCSTTSGRVRGDFPDNCKQHMIIIIIKIEDVEAMNSTR